MQRDEIYQKAVTGVEARQIAVKTSRLIRMAPNKIGENFAF